VSPTGRAAAVEENLLDFFRQIAALPGGELDDGPRLLRWTTGLPSPMHNGVARADLAEDEVETAVAEIAGHFAGRGVPFFWWTGPSSSPSDLNERLERSGLRDSGRDWPGMAMPLDGMRDPPTGIAVERVEGEQQLEEWSRVFAAAFGIPGWAGQSWVGAARRRGFAGLPWRHYLARLDGQPVGTGLAHFGADVVGLYGIATIPEARRRGVGAALTLVPMHEARDERYRAAILHTTPEGEPLCRSLGFVEYCRISRFVGG
jgi:GNAT superfamily N-acetyltransferase